MPLLLLSSLFLLVSPFTSFLTTDGVDAASLSCSFLQAGTVLRPMMINSDVVMLQRLLNLDLTTQVAKSGVGSPGRETNKYGVGTFAAIKRFQEKYKNEILTPVGLHAGTGLFGPATRRKLLALCQKSQGGSIIPTVPPSPTPTNPTAKAGPTITMTSPISGSTATIGFTVLVDASVVSQTSKVASVDMYINDAFVKSTNTPVPGTSHYLLEWNTLLSSEGSYSLSVVAHDALGATTKSSPLLVTLTRAQISTGGGGGGGGSVSVTPSPGPSIPPTPTPVTGVCGSSHGSSFSTTPTSGFCSAGDATSVTGSGPWNWTCVGQNGGATASCSASVTPAPTNGSCGAANGATLSSAPTSNLCTLGNATSVTGSGPWSWSCAGLNGGSTASCSASVVVPPSSSCGADIGGWTTPVPTPVVGTTQVARKSITESGSRIYYISAATGDDTTGEIYFWNGSAIIDSTGSTVGAGNVAYGTDPMNPTGPIKPFKRWAYVGPRRNGGDIGTNATPGEARPGTRAGYPDWFLFKRGETYDLSQDLISFWKEKNPTWTGPSVNGSLSLSAGKSPTERKIMAAYGNVCDPRPRFIHPQDGFVSIFASPNDALVKDIAYLSLHFDGHDRSVGKTFAGLFIINQTAASTDWLFEDVWLDGVNGSAVQGDAEVTFRRSLFTDAFGSNGGHVEGMYYQGTVPRDGILRFKDSILLRNGFSNGDIKNTGWPPTGAQIWDIYSRNLYLSGTTNPSESGFYDSVSMIGASGDQFRSGFRVERSFFYQGYITEGAHNGEYFSTPQLASGKMIDNVLQNFIGTGTNDNRGHPGWGIVVGGGATNVDITRNITTNAAALVPNTWRAFAFTPSITDCEVNKTYLRAPTKGNTVHDNIFDAGVAAEAITVIDGVNPWDEPCMQWKYPAITGNAVTDNTLITSKMKAWSYLPTAMASTTSNDTVFARNTVYPNRDTAAQALGWTGQNRTLKTYMESQGVTVTSSDGFPEYFAKATAMRRGSWDPKWTSKPIVNYFKTGFGMTPLP